MKRSHACGLVALLASLVVGCSAASDGGSESSGCEPNPELNVGTQSLGGTTDGPASNGVRLNGVHFNGVKYNGVRLNGVRFNGVKINGIKFNGVKINGVRLNGVKLNGVALDELVGTTADGTTVNGDAFVGATLAGVLSDGRTIDLVVEAFERSADNKVAHYALSAEGENICGEGTKGLFLPGVWDETAARHDSMVSGGEELAVSFSCVTGVLAKCVDWGYAPWDVGADLHQACTRMGRADYCGTGVSYTKDGTAIDIFDARQIQSPTNDPSFAFEAGWGVDGAVCVSRTRYSAQTSNGAAVPPSCLAALPRCGSFAEATARGAAIGNASRPQSRLLCSATP
jgi:uncharacterized protein YjbI with pentapeptide repeats